MQSGGWMNCLEIKSSGWSVWVSAWGHSTKNGLCDSVPVSTWHWHIQHSQHSEIFGQHLPKHLSCYCYYIQAAFKNPDTATPFSMFLEHFKKKICSKAAYYLSAPILSPSCGTLWSWECLDQTLALSKKVGIFFSHPTSLLPNKICKQLIVHNLGLCYWWL